MKYAKLFLISLPVALIILSACGTAAIQPTPTILPNPTRALPTAIPPTQTQTVEPTQIPSSTPTTTPEPTATPTPTPTLIPFAGFKEQFRFYRTWNDNGKTIFYFLNAGIDQQLYARINQFQLVCEHDTETQFAMKCISNDRIELGDEKSIPIEFFADKDYYQSVYQYEINIPKALVPVYSNEFDCPDRGQRVQCEYEYRQYSSICTTSITCYDACGYYYSIDNIPAGMTGSWIPVGSCQ